MEYEILDELMQTSEERREAYQEKNKVFFISSIEELQEPFGGSTPEIKAYIFNNYVSLSGLTNLLIIIRDKYQRTDDKSGFAIHTVEQAIFPLYQTDSKSFDIPPSIEAPELPIEAQKFIFEKRSLPKKKNDGIIADASRQDYKWTVNQLAERLHLSNRRVALFCRAKGI